METAGYADETAHRAAPDARAPHDTSRPCVVCGVAFNPLRPTHLTCGRACRTRYDLDALAREIGVAPPHTEATSDAERAWRMPLPARKIPPLGKLFSVHVLGGDPGLYTRSNATLMHGVLTALTDLGHQPAARFAAWPSGSHWTMLLDAASVRGSLGGRVHRVMVGAKPRDVAVSEGHTIEAPQRRYEPGRHLVRIETLTPVVIRAGAQGRSEGESEHRRTRTAPDALNLSSALATTMLARLGWRPRCADVLPVELLEANTRPSTIGLQGELRGAAATSSARGSKIGGDGYLRGWEGTVVVETSALGAWLFEVAARVGLGGRVAFGCGRIDVRVDAVAR
jgi:hypothetical protein